MGAAMSGRRGSCGAGAHLEHLVARLQGLHRLQLLVQLVDGGLHLVELGLLALPAAARSSASAAQRPPPGSAAGDSQCVAEATVGKRCRPRRTDCASRQALRERYRTAPHRTCSAAAPPCWPARQAENGAGGVRAVRGRRQLVAGGGGRRRRHVCHGRPRQPPAAPPAVSRTSFSALRRLYSSSSELLELVVEGLRCRLFFSFFSFFSFLCFPITPEFRAGRPRCARLTPEATRFSHCCTGCTAQLE